MSLPEMESGVPEFDPLTEARRYHAEAMIDYLSSPNRPGRLVLNMATTNYQNALASHHDVHANDLAVLPEEKRRYYQEFNLNLQYPDNHTEVLITRFKKVAAALGVTAFSLNSITEGNLYIRPDSIIASFLLGYALWPMEKQETDILRFDDLDDPFELTHKVLNTSTHFFKRKLVKQDGSVVDLPNHRSIARRRLLSKKRRFISTLAGQV